MTDDPANPRQPVQAVAIIGGATAGAEVAAHLAERGVLACVFEQNTRPFGKIEDGLPRWHSKLRHKEYARITDKLSHPNVHLIPRTSIGIDVPFDDLLGKWQFAAVVMANGAWHDRPLPVLEGPDPSTLISRGFEYQNPFVIAFNHAEDASFTGRRIPAPATGGGCVIGGGLAAIDVAKILNLEATLAALTKHGVSITIEELEHHGIDKTLDDHGLVWDNLGIRAATIFYRGRISDMAVIPMPEGADAERRAKIEATREKLIAKLRAKFLIEVEPLAALRSFVVFDGRVSGIVMARTVIADGRVVRTDETFEVSSSIVISSIGSIPRPIGGLPMRGELFDIDPHATSNIIGRPNVFAVGNVLTGKGNIAVSRHHAIDVTEQVIAAYLGVADQVEATADPHAGPAAAADAARQTADEVLTSAATLEAITPETLAHIQALTSARQAEVNYPGTLEAWLTQTGPAC